MQTKKIQHSKSGNKLADWPIRTLILSMGMPMVLSMVLQAVYNIVDTIFVSHMKNGETAVLALTDSYSIQLLIVAIGVGTGIGINALLAKTLGERDGKKAAQIAGNGIFLGICIFLAFFLFGIFGVRGFIAMQAKSNALRQEMGTTYLTICCLGSFGNIGYTVYERFLQSTGRTNLSTIAQISGAVLNMILDPVFIFALDMGVAGAAVATVIGQVVSLLLALLRLIVLPIPLCLLFLQWKTGDVFVWWAFPIAEVVTAVTAVFLLHQTYRKRQKETHPGN